MTDDPDHDGNEDYKEKTMRSWQDDEKVKT